LYCDVAVRWQNDSNQKKTHEKKLSRANPLTRFFALGLLLLIGALLRIPSAFAQTISYANPANVAPTLTSSSGSADLTISTGTISVGDMIKLGATVPTGFTANTSYYVVSAADLSHIQLSLTPGGTAITATSATSGLATTGLFQNWQNTANWTGAVVPNANTVIASIGSGFVGAAGLSISGSSTISNLTFVGSGANDLNLVGGGNGTSVGTLTFATPDSTTPSIVSSGVNRIVNLGNGGQIKIAGSQGLLIRAPAAAAISGSGTSAISTAPTKNIRLTSVDWTGFSGELQIEREVVQAQGTDMLPHQTLTVGNAQTTANNLLAGLDINSRNTTVDGLNGTSLGRIYNNGASAATLTVGVANGSGTYAGVIGKDFTGASVRAVNLTKIGSGTQTISGVIAGTGAVTANGAGGSLILSGANTYTSTTTISAGTLLVNGTHVGGGNYTVNSGGTLGGTGTITPKSGAGIIVNSVGILAPGASIGTLTLDGSATASTLLTFASGAILSYELGAGNTSDTLNLLNAQANDAVFNNNVINFTDTTAGSLSSGQYPLFSSDAAGAYSGLTLFGSLITGGLSIGTGLGAYSSDLEVSGNNIVLNIAPVPEPSVVALLGAGIVGLGLMIRHRR